MMIKLNVLLFFDPMKEFYVLHISNTTIHFGPIFQLMPIFEKY